MSLSRSLSSDEKEELEQVSARVLSAWNGALTELSINQGVIAFRDEDTSYVTLIGSSCGVGLGFRDKGA